MESTLRFQISAGVVAASQIVLISNSFRTNFENCLKQWLPRFFLRVDSLQKLNFLLTYIIKRKIAEVRITKNMKCNKYRLKARDQNAGEAFMLYNIIRKGLTKVRSATLMKTNTFFFYKVPCT